MDAVIGRQNAMKDMSEALTQRLETEFTKVPAASADLEQRAAAAMQTQQASIETTLQHLTKHENDKVQSQLASAQKFIEEASIGGAGALKAPKLRK